MSLRLPEIETFYPILAAAGKVLIILVGAWITSQIVSRLLGRLNLYAMQTMEAHAGATRNEIEKRAKTITAILSRSAMLAIWASAIIMALREGFGIEATPILASAGVVGLAVGFGAQNLVRDVITGLFMLLENQIRINDVAVINGTGGLVEEINLRTTVLRGLDGTVHIFPNGSIQTVSNMTVGFSYYVFDIGVAYKEDTDRVVEVLKEIAAEMWKEEAFRDKILEPLDVLGVDKFADSAVIVKVRIKTVPLAQWSVGREMNRRIKKRFDELGIEIPFPHRTLYFGATNTEFRVPTDDARREEIREIVREVMRESQRASAGQ